MGSQAQRCAGENQATRKEGKPTADLEADLRELERDLPERPKLPRLLYADATPEALAYGLAKALAVRGVISAEAGIVWVRMGWARNRSCVTLRC